MGKSFNVSSYLNKISRPPTTYSYVRNFPAENYQIDNISQLDYGSILQMTSNFRQAKGFDAPGHYYFRVLFDFDKRANLLSLQADDMFTIFPGETGFSEESIHEDPEMQSTRHIPVNTALNYLLLNREWERSRKLIDFVSLLSNIAKGSPWYFSEIAGLENAIERKEVTDGKFQIEEQRKSIQLKCLPDSFDMRIGTMLDLYRDIVYSYPLHKEIVPANLRKFDMGILIFNTPIMNIHRGSKFSFRDYIMSGARDSLLRKSSTSHSDSVKNENSQISGVNTGNTPLGDLSQDPTVETLFATIDPDKSNLKTFKASVKYIELQNCEIDYNSSKEAVSGLNNQDGFQMAYTINIFFDNAVEYRFSDQLEREIGDVNFNDIYLNLFDSQKKDEISMASSSSIPRTTLSMYSDTSRGAFEKSSKPVSSNNDSGMFSFDPMKTVNNLVNTTVGYAVHQAVDPLVSKMKSLYLGNFYTTSPVRGLDTIKGLLAGNTPMIIEKAKKKISLPEEKNHRGWTVVNKKRFEGYSK